MSSLLWLFMAVCIATTASAGKCKKGQRKVILRQGGDMNDFFDVKFISGAGVEGDADNAVTSPACSQEVDENTCLQVKPKGKCDLFKFCISTKNIGTVAFQWKKGDKDYEEDRVAMDCDECDRKCKEFEEGKNKVTALRYCLDDQGCVGDRMKIGDATSIWCCDI